MTRDQFKRLEAIYSRVSSLAFRLRDDGEIYDIRQVQDRLFNMIQKHNERPSA